VSLIENGVNPEALAQVVKELRKESAALQVYSLFNGRISSSTLNRENESITVIYNYYSSMR